MKVNIEIDCTPLEARQFFGLPDVAPMQKAVMDKLQQQMTSNIEKISPESLIQSWFGPGIADPSFPPFSQPALAVWGMNDRSHRKSDKRSLLNIAPHALYVERENVGHFPEIEDPEWFEALLKEFLRDGA